MRAALALALISTLFATNSYSQEPTALERCTQLYLKNQRAEAEPFCAKAERESIEGMLVYGDFLFQGGDFRGAIRRYEGILLGSDLTKLNPLQLMALGHRAIAKMKDGQDESARRDANAYLTSRPKDTDMLGMLSHFTQSNDDRVEYAGRLVALKPQDMNAHLDLVEALIRNDQGEDAITAAEAAMKLDPKSAIAQTWRGFAYAAAGDHEKAERDHAAVARRLPKEADPRVNQANSLIELQRYSDAIAAASEALELKPDHYQAFTVRAEARLRLGDGEGALADYHSAQQVATSKVYSNLEDRANHVIETHEAMSSGSLSHLEADRTAVLEAVADDMHRQCGNYQLPDYEDNENLNAYRECVVAWSKANENMAANFSPQVNATVERFYGHDRWLESAAALRCSKMPKKSRCVSDAAYARAEAAFVGMDNPALTIGQMEWDRLNDEVDAYNARLGRQNVLNKTATFLDALANALSEQADQ